MENDFKLIGIELAVAVGLQILVGQRVVDEAP